MLGTKIKNKENNMKKVVINTCYGGFGLSNRAIRLYLELKGIPFEERVGKYKEVMFCKPGGADWSLYTETHNMERTDPFLVQVVETLGDGANGEHANLVVEEVPTGTSYRIKEYDGKEWIETKDEIDWSVA
jgi:hypothetical protein